VNSPSGKRGASVAARRKTPGETGKRPGITEAIVRPLAVAMILVLAAAIVANSMTKEIGRDEQMYCTAGVLLAQGEMIYRDFSYPSQLPYHPLLLAACYKVLGTTHYLLVGRLVSVASDVLTTVLLLLIYRSVFGARRTDGLLFGLTAAVLYVFNPFVDYAAGYAWNHDVVILCVALALWLLVTADFQSRNCYRPIGLIGAVLTFASFMRVTTALVELVFLAAILWMAGGSLGNRVRRALPFLAGALVMCAWPVWVVGQAPEAFRLNLVRIPLLYGQWLHEIGVVYSKIGLTVDALRTPGTVVLVVLAGGLLWAGLRYRSGLDTQERRKALVGALLPLVFVVIAYIPPTMWLQYLAIPVPFVVAAFAYPLLALQRQAASDSLAKRMMAFAMPAAALVSVLAGWTVLLRTVFVLLPEKWEPMKVHEASRAVTEQVKEPRLVLTLGPLYALEGGCDIYAELASGSIVYRIADRITAAERQITRTIGRETLDSLVADHPPTAVIVGVEPPRFSSLEDPLRRIVPPGWRAENAGSLRAYVRP